MVPIEARLRLLTRADGSRGIQVTVRDLRERRRAERERAELEARLLQSQKMEAVGRLAGGLAHDFNNYLTVILGNADWLIEELPKDSPLMARINEINGAAERSAALTRQLLAFSRKQVFQPRVIDPSQLLLDLDRMLRRLLGEDIELATIRSADAGRVRADPAQLETAIFNLAVNARDAMPRGGKLTLETGEVYFDAESAAQHPGLVPGRFVMIAVTDDGCGMDEPTRAHIFEPFFTTKREGTGLGLATVQRIIEQHGGAIQMSSQPGAGTCFRVQLRSVELNP
jgi:signal transduction histidine kinase